MDEKFSDFIKKVYKIEHEIIIEGESVKKAIYSPEMILNGSDPYMIGDFNATEFIAECQTAYLNGELDEKRLKYLQERGLLEDKFSENVSLFVGMFKKELAENPDLTAEQILSYKKTVQKKGISRVEGYKLGTIDVQKWLIWARKAAREGDISDEWQQTLLAMGIDIIPRHPEYGAPVDFDDAVRIIKAEMESKHITCDQMAYIERKMVKGRREAFCYEIDGWKCGAWLNRQRTKYLKGELSLSEKEALEELGLSVRFNFDTAIALIDEELAENPNLTINDIAKRATKPGGKPEDYKIAGHNMTAFLEGLKEKYKNGLLSEEQIEQLEKRGFMFGKHVSVAEGVGRIKAVLESGEVDLATLGRLTKNPETGKYESYQIGDWLVGFWLRKVRLKLNGGKLSAEEEQMLSEIGVIKFSGRNMQAKNDQEALPQDEQAANKPPKTDDDFNP